MAKIQDIVIGIRGFQKYAPEVKRWNEIMQNAPIKGDVEGTIDRIERQSKFVVEEATEIQDGAILRDVQEMLDGFLDTRFVNDQIGVYLESLGVDLDAAWAEVCRSNNSKFSTDLEMMKKSAEALEVKGRSTNDKIVVQESCEKGVYILKRTSDGKIMKPLTFSEPNLRQFIPKALRGKR
jgi:hypothetical protein